MEATRRSYDTVAERYAAEFRSELDHKPLDRALLDVVSHLAGEGTVADVGAGPGHVTDYLRRRGARAFALDLSPGMCAVAWGDAGVPAVAADMGAVPLAPSSVGAIVCMYAVIHLDGSARDAAYSEFARILRPGGCLLVAFHVSDADAGPGGERALAEWWGHQVDLVFRFLDPAREAAALRRAGFEVRARLEREPDPAVEHASRRACLLLRKVPGGEGAGALRSS